MIHTKNIILLEFRFPNQQMSLDKARFKKIPNFWQQKNTRLVDEPV
jgi:hypothetical protein